MDNMNRIEALSEAISILYQANGRNCCEWAENRVLNAIKYLKPQQSALCVEQFPTEPPSCT